MAHFAVFAPPLPGHFNPLLVLADTLTGRGHRVTFVGQQDAAALIGRHTAAFEAVGTATHPPGALERRIAAMRHPLGVRRTIREVAALTDMLCREAPAALRAIGADAVLSDQMEAAGGLVARHLGLPLVSVATALPINREESVPPPYVGWGHDPSERGRWWNRGGWRVTDALMAPVNRVIADHSERFGLPAIRRTEDCLSERLQIAQAVAGLDFPRSELPGAFHYLGPFRAAEEPPFELPEEDGRPLAFCSLGTLQGSRAGLFRRVAEAARRKGLRLVVAHGGRLSEEAARSLPGDPIVRAFVPQRAVLARCRLAVTHAGFNTVLDALSLGVPLVALPLAFEQPATAARLKRAGAGRVVSPRSSPRTLARAIEEVLGDERYARAAARLKAEIAGAGGVERAADLIEAALRRGGGGAPPGAPTRGREGRGDAPGDSRSGNR